MSTKQYCSACQAEINPDEPIVRVEKGTFSQPEMGEGEFSRDYGSNIVFFHDRCFTYRIRGWE